MDVEMTSVKSSEDLKEILVVLDRWTRTCDTVLVSLDDQIKKIIKNQGS